MNEAKIKGGYILLSRKLIESEIFRKPPLYLKVWVYILSKAQHQQYKQLERGQLWTSIPEIQEACSWYVGFRKEVPSKKKIYSILDWLRNPHEEDNEKDTNGTMIETTKGTQGILITIGNFNFYQCSKNYERNSEGNNENPMKEQRTEVQGNNINNNDNNDNNDNKSKDIYSVLDNYTSNDDLRQALRDFLEMRKKIKAPLTDRAFNMLLKELDKLGSTDEMKIKLLEQSILNNWKSVYPLKQQQAKPQQPKPNKFHNFTQHEHVPGELDAMAEKKREEMMKKMKDKGEFK